VRPDHELKTDDGNQDLKDLSCLTKTAQGPLQYGQMDC